MVPCPQCQFERSPDGAVCSVCKETFERAKVVESTFRVKSGIYLIGSLERGGTVYNQQLRAHNLVWSLWELHKRNEINIKRVAIVGGGIGGLTAAACSLSRFDKTVSITLFERLWDLCPLQQGSDNRWLHPRIYEWPANGSRAPGASLPILNWSEGRASDVARTIVREFGYFSEAFAKPEERLVVYVGVRRLGISAANNTIEWIGSKAQRVGSFLTIQDEQGDAANFDLIILAVGFGLEVFPPHYGTQSYWRNEQLAQSELDGCQQTYLISGFGDGALIDTCRLLIERYRQDTIVYELFSRDLEGVEECLTEARRDPGAAENAFQLFEGLENTLLLPAKAELAKRIRKDTRVVLHIRGKRGDIKSFSDIFGPNSSFLNRMLVFLLYKCDAFSISLDDLESTVRRHKIPLKNVLCRYGADPLEHMRSIFVDFVSVENRLIELKQAQNQKPKRLWQPGTFPHYDSVEKG